MQPEAYRWADVPEDLQDFIIESMGEDWDASCAHGGPLVVVFPTREHKLPTAVSLRLDAIHDKWQCLHWQNQIISIWYDEVGITL